MTYEEFKQNFLPEFLNIKSFSGKMKYANERLTRIGSGTGRVVYDIDGEKVLKLAKNPKGIAQNEAEAGAGYYRDTHDVVAIVFDSADDDSWLIAEKGKKVNEPRIIQLTGIPSLNELWHYVKNFDSENHGRGEIFHQDPEMKQQLIDNEWVNDIVSFIANYGQQPGDYGRPSTYGEVLRDGQPTIVLTDYGLNDEVYDTYYKPKRDKYGMYELYNFADGNDDMLSDMPPQDAVDTRQAMWGLMPYSVGDGPGVINEDFISFILDRDKYPTRDLPSAPYIVDEFHDVVNNLKETLDHVGNKKKFYNNLLELQDYLIRRKFYDREPLEEETVELHETTSRVKPMELGQEYADGIANALAEKLNLGTPDYLGGGGFGHAYLINNNRVLKLTSDVCEIDAGLKTQRAKPKTLVYVYNVYKVTDTENGIAVYALIEDYIAHKPHAEFIRYTEIINSLGNDLYGRLLRILIKGNAKKADVEFAGKTLNDFPELARLILTSKLDANINQADRQKAYEFMMGLYAIKLDLIRLAINSVDFMTISNLGYKDGVLIYYDIGGCIAKEPQLPPENQITLPEAEEISLDEDVTGVPREISNKIANTVAQKYNYGQPKYIGEGSFGYAYDIGNNMILKVTRDPSEANENLALMGKPLKYIAEPHKVFSVKPTSGETPLFVIILEKLQTDPAKFRAIKDRMDFAFKRIMQIDYPDVVDYYVNGPQPGLDVDEEKVKKYMARNPQDAEFFNSVVRIGKEAKQYGVESMDYVQPANLGYKPDGSLGFFDVGFGNYFFKADTQPEEIQVNEDGTSKFSTSDGIGRDNFPAYNNDDDSPMTDNNIPTTVDEDLEYHHVVGDATEDKYELDERIKSAMPGSTSVEIKKKCRLGGLGNTSAQCNWGDINAVKMKSMDETAEVKLPSGNLNAYESFPILNDGQTIGELNIIDRGVWGNNHYIALDKIFIDKEFRGMGYANEAMEDLFEYADRNNIIITLTPDSLWGANKEKLRRWYQSLGFVMNKGKKKDFQTMQLMYKLPKTNINEAIDASEAYASDKAIKTVLSGKRDVGFAELNQDNIKFIEKNGLHIIPVRLTLHHNIVGIIYRDKVKADRLYEIAKSKGGYLKDNSPEEAREIGQLLGYKEASIEEYIRRKYGNKIPTAPEPKDFNNLDEDNSQYDKQIEKDVITHGLNARYVRTYKDADDTVDVYTVNGDEMRDSGFIEWVDGGNHWVDADLPKAEQKYAKRIPEDKIVVDDVFVKKPIDFEGILLHERTESYIIKHFGYEYDDAHVIANKIELAFRKRAVSENITTDEDAERLASLMYVAFKKHFKGNEKHNKFLNKGNNQLTEAKFTEEGKYYRAVSEFMGDEVEFEPNGYYEAIDDDGYPVMKYDTFWMSDKGEVAASKSIGGAVMGIYSMMKFHSKIQNNIYLYEINEKPDVDISHWDYGDFTYLKEVRYRKPVKGKYIGKVTITDDMKQKFDAFYELQGLDAYDEPDEKSLEIVQDTNYDKYLADVDNLVHENMLNENMIEEAEIMSLQDLPFKQEVEQLGGKIFSVGGAVRDEFLGKQSKDLDVLITGIPMDQLEEVLSKYGRVDAVGKSFGVLKFRPKGGEEIDIAIPRTEKPTGAGGHQGFDVSSDHALPIEKDLERRDFTINAIARDTKGNLVDPFGGTEDLKNKIIRMANPEAFSDDPLRMLRAVQFASRFGFTIEPETMKTIQSTAERIKEIPPERILIEFDKIVKKGNKLTGVQLLKDSGLFNQIFGFDIQQSTIDRSPFNEVKTMGEFIFLLTKLLSNPAAFYKTNLKGDIPTFKEIKALELAFGEGDINNPIMARSVVHNMYLLSPQALQSQIIPKPLQIASQELLQGKYPKTVNELAVNGDDLMKLGLQGKAISDMQKSLLLKIYADKVRNSKEDLLNLAGQKSNGLTEYFEYPKLPREQNPTWNINGQNVDINFFTDQYYQWNQGAYDVTTTKSVQEFLDNEYPDFGNDEKLKHDLYHKLVDNEILDEDMISRVSYSAVVLDKDARFRLVERFKKYIPQNFEIIANHMTINMGEIDPEYAKYLGMSVNLTIEEIAMDDKVVAVGVSGFYSKNPKPHITLAVNTFEGGKPKMSNYLTNWEKVKRPLTITGKVTEVGYR